MILKYSKNPRSLEFYAVATADHMIYDFGKNIAGAHSVGRTHCVKMGLCVVLALALSAQLLQSQAYNVVSSSNATGSYSENGLVMNYYGDSCPQAEEIIAEQVRLLYKRHKNTAFSWLRNIFHDCAVEVSFPQISSTIIFL